MTTVLLTGAGGAAIPYLIEGLHQRGYRVLTADMDPNAVGLYLSDAGYIIPPGKSPEFLSVLRNICHHEKVNVVVPLVDEELLRSLELEKDNLIVVLPEYDFVNLCLDKYQLMKKLKGAGILIPDTHLISDSLNDIHYPVVVKPRTGRGSRGLGIIYSEVELASFLESSPYQNDELLLQTYIDGLEYTVSVVVWRDGEVQAVVPKEIIFKKGITHFAVTRRNEKIETLCKRIQEKLHANGPFNVQLRLEKNTGTPLLFEINPRFSTTVSLTMAAGVDEVGGLISHAIGDDSDKKFTQWKEGVVLMRRTLDEFVDEPDFRNRQIQHGDAIIGV